jgi:hypothetical protein
VLACLVNNEVEMIWQEVVVSYYTSRKCSDICLEENDVNVSVETVPRTSRMVLPVRPRDAVGLAC